MDDTVDRFSPVMEERSPVTGVPLTKYFDDDVVVQLPNEFLVSGIFHGFYG
jgi:hypothetical protein